MPHVTINGKSIFYTVATQASSVNRGLQTPPITTLFIHGLGSSSCFYHTITPKVSEISKCIALDTPGSGLSALGVTPQTVGGIADDVIALLDSLDIKEKFVVVGHSMGGIIASEIAVKYPERVQAVVLLGPVNPSLSVTGVFETRIKMVENDGLELLANTIPSAATGSTATSLTRAFVRALILSTSVDGYLSLCRVIAAAQQPQYEKIKVPLLILAGADDKTSPLEACKEIFDAYATSSEQKQLLVLPGVGHWHCVEGSELVGNHIVEFYTEYLRA